MTRFLAIALLFSAACGTTGDPSTAPLYAPISGAGPFRRLPSDDSLPFTAPFVLADPTADFDDPSLVTDGEQLTVWLTARRGDTVRIERAEATRLSAGFAATEPVLEADAAWEMGAVASPSVVAGSPWLLFYSAGSAIGWATSSDGKRFVKAPDPALMADGGDEGAALGPPAAERLGAVVRLYYPASGRLWAAEAPFEELAAGRPTRWTRLDGDPTTPGRDPMVGGAPWATAIGRAMARTVITPAGRARHDLYFNATQPMNLPASIGFAASFTGDRFAVAKTPILTPPEAASPSVAAVGDELLLLFSAPDGHRAIAAALSP